MKVLFLSVFANNVLMLIYIYIGSFALHLKREKGGYSIVKLLAF